MFALIVNHQCREYKLDYVNSVIKYFEAHDREIELFDSKNFASIQECIRAAITSSQSKLLVIGGDSLARLIIQSAIELKQKKPLGIIPNGDICSLASLLQVPDGINEICETLIIGHVKNINLGELIIPDQNLYYFHNFANVGISTIDAKTRLTCIKDFSSFQLKKALVIGKAMIVEPEYFDIHFSSHTKLASDLVISTNFAVSGDKFHAFSTGQVEKTTPWKLMTETIKGKYSNQDNIIEFEATEVTIHKPGIPIMLDGDSIGATPCVFKFSKDTYPVITGSPD